MDPLQLLIAGFIVGWVVGVGTRMAADNRRQTQPSRSVAVVHGMLASEKYREDVVQLDDGGLMHVRMEEN